MDSDTLNSIAIKFETTPTDLARLNKKPLANFTIFSGDVSEQWCQLIWLTCAKLVIMHWHAPNSLIKSLALCQVFPSLSTYLQFTHKLPCGLLELSDRLTAMEILECVRVHVLCVRMCCVCACVVCARVLCARMCCVCTCVVCVVCRIEVCVFWTHVYCCHMSR